MGNRSKGDTAQERKDWNLYYRYAHKLTEEEVALIPTEAVREAFACCKLRGSNSGCIKKI